jgi:hypothetical protein
VEGAARRWAKNCPKHVELVEYQYTVIVASSWSHTLLQTNEYVGVTDFMLCYFRLKCSVLQLNVRKHSCERISVLSLYNLFLVSAELLAF